MHNEFCAQLNQAALGKNEFGFKQEIQLVSRVPIVWSTPTFIICSRALHVYASCLDAVILYTTGMLLFTKGLGAS